MPDAARSIFNKKATERLRNPDDLDKYIQVTNPSVWVVLVGCLALLVGLLCWGVFGAVTTSVSATGVSVNNQAICFLTAEDAAKVNEGDVANVGGKSMTVVKVTPVPLSRQEASEVLENDYLVSTLMPGDWAYQVTFDGDVDGLASGVPLAANITTERVAPIRLVLKNWG